MSRHWRTEADDVAIGIDDRALVLTPTRCRPACGKRLRICACDLSTSKMERAARLTNTIGPESAEPAYQLRLARLVVIADVIVPNRKAKVGHYAT